MSCHAKPLYRTAASALSALPLASAQATWHSLAHNHHTATDLLVMPWH